MSKKPDYYDYTRVLFFPFSDNRPRLIYKSVRRIIYFEFPERNKTESLSRVVIFCRDIQSGREDYFYMNQGVFKIETITVKELPKEYSKEKNKNLFNP